MSDPQESRIIKLGNLSSTRSIMLHQAVADYLGLNPTDHKCLIFLHDGPKTPGQLAEDTGLTTGALTSVIDRLEKAGYVKRTPDPHDRRRILVAAQPKVTQKIVPLFEPLAKDMLALEAKFTPEQLDCIYSFMEQANIIVHRQTLAIKAQTEQPDTHHLD